MTTESNSNDISKCPFHSGAKQVGVGGGGSTNRDWWPNRLHLSILRQHSSLSDPQDKDFNYVEEFKTLDYEGLIFLFNVIFIRYGFIKTDKDATGLTGILHDSLPNPTTKITPSICIKTAP